MLLHQPTASSPAQVHELPPPLRVLTTTSASRGAFPKLLLSPPKPFPACSSLKNPIPSLIQPLPRTTTPTCHPPHLNPAPIKSHSQQLQIGRSRSQRAPHSRTRSHL